MLITPTASKDIKDAIRYIQEDLKNPSAANALLEKLKQAVISLGSFPFRHHLVADTDIAKLSIRKIYVDNYIVFYTIYEDKATVDIIRVLYGRRNWMNLI